MSAHDPSEILAVCESAMADSELTPSELYRLAEWLNDHREACFHWPGKLLVRPLQEVWKDGAVSPEEAAHLATLLSSILKDAAKQRALALAANVRVEVARAVRIFDPGVPLLPAIGYQTKIESRPNPRQFYAVELAGPTCTCPDFAAFRSALPTGHLSRCCRHIFDAFNEVEPADKWPAWLRSFLDVPWVPFHEHQWTILDDFSAPILISTAPRGWANAFVSDRGPYECFGYSLVEKRWSYGRPPREEARIKRALMEFNSTNAPRLTAGADFDDVQRNKYPSYFLRLAIADAHRSLQDVTYADDDDHAELAELTNLRVRFWKATFHRLGAVSEEGDELIEYADAIDDLYQAFGRHFKVPSEERISGVLAALDAASVDWDQREPIAFYATLQSNFPDSQRKRR